MGGESDSKLMYGLRAELSYVAQYELGLIGGRHIIKDRIFHNENRALFYTIEEMQTDGVEG